MSVKQQFFAAGALFAVLFIVSPGSAVAAGPPVAGAGLEAPQVPAMLIVDTERVLSESKAMKGLQGQIEGQQQALQKEFGKKQDDLRSAETELRKEQGTIATDVFQDKVKAFEKRVAEVQRDAASRKQALEQGFNATIGKVKQALVEVVRDIATERHANMVVQAGPFLIFDPGYDVSADALHRLDQKLPSVQLVLPKVPPPGAAPESADGNTVAAAPAPAPTKKK
jgi:outer membrane protein